MAMPAQIEGAVVTFLLTFLQGLVIRNALNVPNAVSHTAQLKPHSAAHSLAGRHQCGAEAAENAKLRGTFA
jgi:hypothetical protein